jgi:hypothetical protein
MAVASTSEKGEQEMLAALLLMLGVIFLIIVIAINLDTVIRRPMNSADFVIGIAPLTCFVGAIAAHLIGM